MKVFQKMLWSMFFLLLVVCPSFAQDDVGIILKHALQQKNETKVSSESETLMLEKLLRKKDELVAEEKMRESEEEKKKLNELIQQLMQE